MMERGYLLAIDPGLDVTGWALFKTNGHRPATLNDALTRLCDSGQLITAPHETLSFRLAHLSVEVGHLAALRDPGWVAVEMPAYAGAYSGGRERQVSVGKLYMAIGAILAALDPRDVVQVPAIRQPKAVRHELLEAAAREALVALPTGPRGGAREDIWDAIWLGVTALMERA
jgi:Holliday junction resolvasome RuvABC endonuclease subunit